ncbi:hypothetical protein MHYP_G00361800 [Metynnis hypsauchen]
MRESWRNEAFKIKEKRGLRARFADLVTFIDRQSKVATDPLFGDLQGKNPPPAGKGKEIGKEGKSGGKGASFATNVAVEKESAAATPKQASSSKIGPSFETPCLFCQGNHTLETCNKIKEKKNQLLLRDLCKEKLGWDEEIDESRTEQWNSPRPPSVSETEVNGSVTLVCVSDSNPASSYTWFRKTGGDITQFGEGANLTLAAGADGVFYCTAENPLGSSTSSERTFTPAGLWKQFAVWGTVGVGSALVLSLITAVLCIQRKRGAARGADVPAPKSGDETYSALNPNITSPDYDTLTPVRDSPSDTYSALSPETRTSDYDTLTVVRPHPVMRRTPENEN